jgi:hypothetical protein
VSLFAVDLLELVVLYSDHSRCGWSYVFNIIVISGHCGVCMYVCVVAAVLLMCSGGVMSFLVSCDGHIILLFGLLARVLRTYSFLYCCTSVGTCVLFGTSCLCSVRGCILSFLLVGFVLVVMVGGAAGCSLFSRWR